MNIPRNRYESSYQSSILPIARVMVCTRRYKSVISFSLQVTESLIINSLRNMQSCPVQGLVPDRITVYSCGVGVS